MEQPEYPDAFVMADASSAWGQRTHLRQTKLQMALLVAGAIAGTLSFPVGNGLELPGIVATVLFVLALFLNAHRASTSPVTAWYQGRAAAESIKTMAWRYAVGGEPFSTSLSPREADDIFSERLVELLGATQPVKVSAEGSGEQITGWMRTTRALDLEARRAFYDTYRLLDQQRWYSRKAADAAAKASRWNTALLATELLGVVAGAMKAFSWPDLVWTTTDFVGVAATLAAVFATWTQTKQFGQLAAAYSLAYQELSTIRIRAQHPSDEQAWANFVDSAEGAISREHSMWVSNRR